MRTTIYWSGLFAIAFSMAPYGMACAQQSADDHVIPAPPQPAPEIPPVPASALAPLSGQKSFSILSRENEGGESADAARTAERQETREAMGTFTTSTSNNSSAPQNQDSPSGTKSKFGTQPSSPPSTTAAVSQTESAFQSNGPIRSNGLRPFSSSPASNPVESRPTASQSPVKDQPSNDSRLRFDQAPLPPQPNDEPVPSVPVEDLQRGTRLPGEDSHFDERMGATPPPVNQAPDPIVRHANTVPAGSSSGVNTVSFEPPTSPAPSQVGFSLDLTPARKAMSRYELAKSDGPLPGAPAKLANLLSNSNPPQRNALIKQYWTAYEDWAMLVNAQQHFLWLSQIQRPDSPSDQLLLTAARGSASNFIIESEIRLDEAMAMLQRLARLNPAARPPLPSDQPLMEAFHTQYAYYSKREPLPFVLKTIDKNLPKMLHLIADRGDTAQMLKSAASQNQNAYVNRQTGFASVLTAAQMWNVAERDLIRSVGKYNRSTAEYATRFRPRQSNRKLVAMVIAKPKTLDAGRSALSRTADASSLLPVARPGRFPATNGRSATLPSNSIALPPARPPAGGTGFSPPPSSNSGGSFSLSPLNSSSAGQPPSSQFESGSKANGTLPDTGGFRAPNQGGASFSSPTGTVTPPPTNNDFGGFRK